jgi:hypothetical protein
LGTVFAEPLQVVLQGIERPVCIKTALDSRFEIADGFVQPLYRIGQAGLFHAVDIRH